MDIITQYYNEAGQIVSRSPDMETREFYRDYLCRHRFNEMFVGLSGNSSPTCSLVNGFALYNYADTSGTQVQISNNDIEIAGDESTGKYLVSTGDRTGSCNIGPYEWGDYNSWDGNRISIQNNMRFGFSFKSPSKITESFANLGMYLQVNCFYLNSISEINFGNIVELGSLSVQFFETPYSGSNISSYMRVSSTANYGNYSEQYDIPFDLDGNIHLAEFKILMSGQWMFYLDGEQILSFDDNGAVSRFYRPTIGVVLMGAEGDDYKYGIKSAWVKNYEI